VLIRDIVEKITIDPLDRKLRVDYNATDGVSTSLGKSTNKNKFIPYLSKSQELAGYTVYSVYSSHDPDTTDVLKAIKKRSDIQIDPEDYRKFVTRTAIFITAKIFSSEQIDCVVTPRSSSNILNDLIAELKTRNPHIKFLPESFVKTVDLSKIELDYTQPGLTDKIARSLNSIIRSATQTGRFEIKKALPHYRKYFKNFFEVVDPAILRQFRNRRVCVLDDVFSSGSTLVAIMKSISDYAPELVIGTSIFKTH
jgi:hypothetical protein